MSVESSTRAISEYLETIDPDERREIATDIGFIVNSDYATEVITASWQCAWDDYRIKVEATHRLGEPLPAEDELSQTTATVTVSSLSKQDTDLVMHYGNSAQPLVSLNNSGEILTGIDEETTAGTAYMGGVLLTSLVSLQANPGLFKLPYFVAGLNAAFRTVKDTFSYPWLKSGTVKALDQDQLSHWKSRNTDFPTNILADLVNCKAGLFTNEKVFFMNSQAGDSVEFRFTTHTAYVEGNPESSQHRSVRLGHYFKAPKGNGFRIV